MAQKRKRFRKEELIRISPKALAKAVLERDVRITHSMLVINRPQWVGNANEVDAHVFVLVERGTLMVQLKDEDILLTAGCVCWIPPGTFRTFRVASGVPVRNWRLRLSVREDEMEIGLNTPTLVRGDAGSILPHLQLLSDVGSNPRFHEEVRPLVSAFMHRFLVLPEISEVPLRQLDGVQRRRVEQLVKRGLLVGVTPGEMAEEAGLSPDYFTRLFKATYGVPPRRYLLQKRMELAGRILKDSALSVKEVCAELGEPDVGTFCRLFKRVTGKTPTQFRKRR